MNLLVTPGVGYYEAGAMSPSDMFLIGGFLLVVGYLLRFRGMVSFVTWTSPDRAGVSESRLTKIAGTTTLAISGLSFLSGVALFAGFPAVVVEVLYYGVAVVLVIVQSLLLRIG